MKAFYGIYFFFRYLTSAENSNGEQYSVNISKWLDNFFYFFLLNATEVNITKKVRTKPLQTVNTFYGMSLILAISSICKWTQYFVKMEEKGQHA